MELKKDVKALDHYYYYIEGNDTTYVLTEMFTVESMSNSVLYRFVPVYGPAEEDYTIPVAYFESFDEALARWRIFRIEDVDDILYQWEAPISY